MELLVLMNEQNNQRTTNSISQLPKEEIIFKQLRFTFIKMSQIIFTEQNIFRVTMNNILRPEYIMSHHSFLSNNEDFSPILHNVGGQFQLHKEFVAQTLFKQHDINISLFHILL